MSLREIQVTMDEIFKKWGLEFLVPRNGDDDDAKLSRSLKTVLNTLDALLTSIPDPLILSDQDGGILLANAEAGKLIGYDGESGLVGKNLDSVIVEKDETAEPSGSVAFEAGHIFEAFLRTADQSLIPVEIHQEVFMKDRPLTLSIARDLTERKAMEAKLVKMAFYDSQTALPNRHYFLEELEKELRKIKENP